MSPKPSPKPRPACSGQATATAVKSAAKPPVKVDCGSGNILLGWDQDRHSSVVKLLFFHGLDVSGKWWSSFVRV